MILYAALRSIGLLYIPTDVGKGTGVLSGNFEGARPPKEFGRNPDKNVKGNGFWRNTYNPALIH